MRKMKRFLSLMLAVVMVLAMSVPVSVEAASDYIITVENSVTDKSYSAYKIFDATYDSNSSSSVIYTIDSNSNSWYSLVSSSGYFTLTSTNTTGVYTVSKAENVTDATIIAWIQDIVDNNKIPSGVSASVTETGNGGSLELDVQSAGYYFITTETGATVTVTTAAPKAEVLDKNQEPGGNLTKTADDTTVAIGSTVTYTITSNVPAYDGTTEITNYTFKDTLDSGLTAPNVDDIVVKIKDSSGKVYAYLSDSVNDVSISVSGQVITISFDPTKISRAAAAETGDTLSDATSYPADATIEIIYTAAVNEKAAYENGNTVNQTWTGETTGETDTEEVYTYGFNLVKKAEYETGITLSGAKFNLTDSEGNIIYFVLDADGNYRKATSDQESDATTEIIAGDVRIYGLDAGEYTLTETEAPNGYNKADPVKVTVGSDYSTKTGSEGINNDATTVVNKAGTTLPESGGMGTTILYIIGGILVIGAAILLITRRRMSQTK